MSFLKLYVAFALAALLLSAPARGLELDAGEKQALLAGHQGGVVVLSNLWSRQRELPALPVIITGDGGPQLLLSDKPEYFYAGNGIALREDVKPGVVRLYVYHVPEPTNGPKTISAVIQNLGAAPLEFRFLHYAFPKPSRDYQLVGKTGLIEFFNSKPQTTIRKVPPGGSMVIDPKMDATTVTTDELAHGFYEFEINQPARIFTFQRDPGQASTDAVARLPLLPLALPGRDANGAGRGLFLTSDFTVTNQGGLVLDPAGGAMRLILADGRIDPAIHGRDGITGVEPVKDSGNYGTMYRIHIRRSSSDGRGLAVLVTKPGRGGKWCGTQSGAVRVNAGVWSGGTIAVPADRVAYGNPGEMVLLQKYPPLAPGAMDTIDVLYSPPGASCIPTPLLFVPY